MSSKRKVANNMAENVLNVAVIGQTGVGKSALINYIFEENVALSDSGKPVTAKGFHCYTKRWNMMQIQLFDSWGLEIDQYEVWFDQLKDFMSKRSYKSAMDQWMHVAIYCINATSNRMQDADIKIIEQLKKEGMNVIVALTKSALTSEETLHQLEHQLKKSLQSSTAIIKINSVEEVIGVHKIPQFGRELLLQEMQKGYLTLYKERLPKRIRHLLIEKLEEYYQIICNCKSRSAAKTKASYLSNVFFTGDYKRIIQSEIKMALGPLHIAQTMRDSTINFEYMSGIQYIWKDVDSVLMGVVAVPFVSVMAVLELFATKKHIAGEMYNAALKEIELEKIEAIVNKVFEEIYKK